MSVPDHHKRKEVCSSRAPYREGRKPKAVKVYTVNQESKYLLVQGVPAVGATQELIKLFAVHGTVTEYRILDDYPADHFTEVYLIKFERIQAARVAKRKLDDWSFYGGILHVCYAPEYETVQETREKLQDRRKAIAAKVRQYEHDGTYSSPYTSASQTVSAIQHQQSGSLFQKDGNKRSGSEMAVDTLQNKIDQSQQQHTCHRNLLSTPVSGFNTPETSRAGLMEMSENPGPSVPQNNMSGYAQPGTVAGPSVQDSNWNNKPHVPSGADFTSAGSWKHFEQTQSKTMTGNEEIQEVQLKLPLPPKPVHHGMSRHNQRLQNYGFAHVPTAQAEFPLDFDARLGSHYKETITDSNESVGHKKNQLPDKLENPNQLSQKAEKVMCFDKNREKSKSMQEKIEENLEKKTDIVIKKLDNNRPVPKFIPRQAQIRKIVSVTDTTNASKTDSAKNDQVNKVLRRNAFTLGKPQGPVTPGSEVVKETEKAEESVNKTVKDIRKRVSQLSENKELTTKKKKTM